jgi:hypothetical protein
MSLEWRKLKDGSKVIHCADMQIREGKHEVSKTEFSVWNDGFLHIQQGFESLSFPCQNFEAAMKVVQAIEEAINGRPKDGKVLYIQQGRFK